MRWIPGRAAAQVQQQLPHPSWMKRRGMERAPAVELTAGAAKPQPGGRGWNRGLTQQWS